MSHHALKKFSDPNPILLYLILNDIYVKEEGEDFRENKCTTMSGMQSCVPITPIRKRRITFKWITMQYSTDC